MRNVWIIFCFVLAGFSGAFANAYETFSLGNGKLFVYKEGSVIKKAILQENGKSAKCSVEKNKLLCENKEIQRKGGELSFGNVALRSESNFSLEKLNITQTYVKKNSIRLEVFCSKDSKIQNVLDRFYGVEFTCQNAKKTFKELANGLLEKGIMASCGAQMGESFEKCSKGSTFEEVRSDSLRYFDENIVVFDRVDYIYSGGAHGISEKKGMIFSLDGRRIALSKILDLQNPKLKELLWGKYQAYQQKQGMKKGESFLKYEEFNVAKALSLDENGIVFIFQPYEILPHSYGVVELQVSFDEIKEFGDFLDSKIAYLFK